MLPCIDQIEDDSEQVDTIVTLIHKQYNSCNFKPSNAYQYTILAALVLVDEACNKFRVISLATGSKCLPTSRFSALGDALHDSHAEVLAKRGALRWFHEEIQRCVMRGHCSEWIERCDELHKWRLKKEVSLFMYISTLPCGDASMRYLASTQDPEIALLKDSSSFPILSPDVTARGRDNYSLFGVLRTKPGRADSPSTLCMSCSDKIAAWNVVGIQGAFGAKLFAPIYISFLIVGEINVNERRQMRTECERALFCRLASVQGLPDGYRVAQTKVLFTSRPFLYSRTSLQSLYSTEKIVSSSNESLCFVADSGFHHEVIINGVKRGVQAKLRGLKKHRPQLCKASLFDLHRETLLSMDSLDYPPTMSYYDAKRSASCEYQLAKSVLRGAGAPFAGWCVSGERWESFDGSGNSISSRETSETLFLEG